MIIKQCFKYVIITLQIIIIMLVSTYVYAQKIAPTDSTLIDKSKVKQCQKIIDDINSMQLTCDTINYIDDGTNRQFIGIYFDKNSRLRKYFRKASISDGSHDYINACAYYDEKGNLVYITCDTGNNCEDNSENYYIHNGLIVDFMIEFNCGCCEDEGLSTEEINRIRPVIGSKLTGVYRNFKNFIYADSLLKILKNKEYDNYGEYAPSGDYAQ